jgi:hypothetical protein
VKEILDDAGEMQTANMASDLEYGVLSSSCLISGI